VSQLVLNGHRMISEAVSLQKPWLFWQKTALLKEDQLLTPSKL